MTAVAQRLAERLHQSIQKQQIYSKLLQSMQEELDAPLRMLSLRPQSPTGIQDFKRTDPSVSRRCVFQVFGAVLELQTMVMTRIPNTTPRDTDTGIL
jgi:hypothetical protein